MAIKSSMILFCTKPGPFNNTFNWGNDAIFKSIFICLSVFCFVLFSARIQNDVVRYKFSR